MSRQTLEATAKWLRDWTDPAPLEISFHGGEPLVAGADFYRMALPLLQDTLAARQVRFSVQSNLWLLNDEICELFRRYSVSIGTSLDGPKRINDAQRGRGYFEKTMEGIERARSEALDVGCICTFTAQSAKYAHEIFDFFLHERLSFGTHAALPSLRRADDHYALAPQEHSKLLVNMLDRYLDNIANISINTLDAMARGISANKGAICTFCDCLGDYLAVDPDGCIYPCQRLVGMSFFRLANLHDQPASDEIMGTAAWHMLEDRQSQIDDVCGDCPHLPYCRGGCPYSVLAANNGRFGGNLRDPPCPASRRVFNEITDRALAEVFDEENMAAVTSEEAAGQGLLRKGKLIRIMRGGPHPQETARRARQVVAATALAVCDTPESALQQLDRAGLITKPDKALDSLRALRRQLDNQSQEGLANAYLHVTDGCNLSCAHCYASATEPADATSMSVNQAARLVRQAAHAGFTKAVITGGEPLTSPNPDALLDALAALRQDVKPLQTVLRTNLAYPLPDDLAEKLIYATDQMVVSIDGDRTSHEARRGHGTYAQTVRNLRYLRERCSQAGAQKVQRALEPTQIAIAAALTPAEMEGYEGEAVRALGEELDVEVRFKPVLPLGCAEQLDLELSLSSLPEDNAEVLAGVCPVATCGLGMNLYVGADGASYPCYALTAPRHYLGNAMQEDVAAILVHNDAYRQVNVDSTARCRKCALRYLCGGYCRAWSKGEDPDAPPPDCSALYRRAEKVLSAALDVLEADRAKWRAAGLPGPSRKNDKGDSDERRKRQCGLLHRTLRS